MAKIKQTKLMKSNELFARADKQQEAGNFRSAFRLFLAAAKLGNSACQNNLGNLYDDGEGVKRNREAALFWYKRSYRNGDGCAAANIANLLEKEGDLKKALSWYLRAVNMGLLDVNVDIARIYLLRGASIRDAKKCLQIVLKARKFAVTEAHREKAKLLLHSLPRIQSKARTQDEISQVIQKIDAKIANQEWEQKDLVRQHSE